MNDGIKLIATFVDAVALIMALVLMVSIMQRIDFRSFKSSLLMGALFSLTVIFSMADPIDLGSAGIFDMRGLLIGTAAALFGPIVGLMTLLAGLVMRWGIGGPGMVPGFIGMLCAYGGGLLWLFTIKDRSFATWKKSVLLGLFITSQMLAILFAPRDIWGMLASNLMPYTSASNILGALLINHLISGELSFLSEAESSKVDANTDHLTGLLNRRGLDMVYPKLERQQGYPRGRALLYFDIDRFKAINDTHGHAVGDAVLQFVTEQVARNLRPNDVFARLGGDEFAVVLSQIDAREAERIAKRCRAVVDAGGFQVGGKELTISISVGAIWMLDHTEIDEILDEADKALYTAKTSGRNKVVFKTGDVRPSGLNLALPA